MIEKQKQVENSDEICCVGSMESMENEITSRIKSGEVDSALLPTGCWSGILMALTY